MKDETTRELEKLTRGQPPLQNSGIFGASIAPEESKLVIIPVPWDASASGKSGARKGPMEILRASHELDLEDPLFGKPYLRGISYLAEDHSIGELNKLACKERNLATARVQKYCTTLHESLKRTADYWLAKGKIVAIVGGDHSVPFSLMESICRQHEGKVGLLHFDAHLDMRRAYEGIEDSHASIIYNILKTSPTFQRTVHLGIRDYSAEEIQFSKEKNCVILPMHQLRKKLYSGENYISIISKCIAELPEKVYVSFDIDGLDPTLCPGTGTPVPGGLSFWEARLAIEELVNQKKQVVAFDLCETAPSQNDDGWDGNVASRVLYSLCGAALHSCSTL